MTAPTPSQIDVSPELRLREIPYRFPLFAEISVRPQIWYIETDLVPGTERWIHNDGIDLPVELCRIEDWDWVVNLGYTGILAIPTR